MMGLKREEDEILDSGPRFILEDDKGSESDHEQGHSVPVRDVNESSL